MGSHSHSHDEPFGKFEHILIRVVITDEKQTGLPEMAHESQGGGAFPVISRRQQVHRCFPKDQARSRCELIEQEEQGHANAGRFFTSSIMQGEGKAFILNLRPMVLERPIEVSFQSLDPSLTNIFSPDQRPGIRVRAFQTMIPDQVGNYSIDTGNQIAECAPGDDGTGNSIRQLRQTLICGLGERDGITIRRNSRQCPIEVKCIENGTARQCAKRSTSFVRKQVGHP